MNLKEYKIGVISDTHSLLRSEVSDVLRSCECIIHAGDIGSMEIISKLRGIRNVYAVRGNIDVSMPADIPEELDLELFGFRIYVVHNKKHIRTDLKDKDIVIYGHSHKYSETKDNNITFLNPGSCGPRRFQLPVTMTVLILYPSEHRFETEKIDFTSEIIYRKYSDAAEKNMDKLIKTVVREIKSGISTDKIAERNHISYELAEQICRIYLTHPGVDKEGILKRMEIKNL